MGAVAGRPAGRRARIIGRDAERARVRAFVAAFPREARALLIRVEPGIGKTAVWQHAVHECAWAGFDVLIPRPAEDEMPLGLAGLVDIFEHVDFDTSALLDEENPFARGRGLLVAMRRLARDRRSRRG